MIGADSGRRAEVKVNVDVTWRYSCAVIIIGCCTYDQLQLHTRLVVVAIEKVRSLIHHQCV
jgi:hypothetical protein